ncbi:Nitric-oxide synthase [Besnoitia besnoiti]|uniref:Nitric-oxide synthase n=1 Tax=Besnoitia besnoiti TaxID=94643 RepID=A0A2A9MHG2_BESBE|nr:Nitric-oxide synthase [Besnoitia besnoiti]PFH37978.1 Nitric-oxide synthase [Besnoitia besnoiti]
MPGSTGRDVITSAFNMSSAASLSVLLVAFFLSNSSLIPSSSTRAYLPDSLSLCREEPTKAHTPLLRSAVPFFVFAWGLASPPALSQPRRSSAFSSFSSPSPFLRHDVTPFLSLPSSAAHNLPPINFYLASSSIPLFFSISDYTSRFLECPRVGNSPPRLSHQLPKTIPCSASLGTENVTRPSESDMHLPPYGAAGSPRTQSRPPKKSAGPPEGTGLRGRPGVGFIRLACRGSPRWRQRGFLPWFRALSRPVSGWCGSCINAHFYGLSAFLAAVAAHGGLWHHGEQPERFQTEGAGENNSAPSLYASRRSNGDHPRLALPYSLAQHPHTRGSRRFVFPSSCRRASLTPPLAAHSGAAVASGASERKKKKHKRKRRVEDGLATSEIDDIWRGDGAAARTLDASDELDERRREALKALEDLGDDSDDPVIANLKKQLREQVEGGPGRRPSADGETSSQRGLRRARIRQKPEEGDAEPQDAMDEIARMDREEEERDRLEEIRMTNPGLLFSTPKASPKEPVPEVYVQSAEIRLKRNRCIGCGAAFQTRNPAKAAYVPPRVLENSASCGSATDADSPTPLATAPFSVSSLDLSDPQSAAKAFASARGDVEKVVSLAARAESVDFETFVSALAEAGGANKQEVLDKLRIACDYNGHYVEDENEEQAGESEAGQDSHHTHTEDLGSLENTNEGDELLDIQGEKDIADATQDLEGILSNVQERSADETKDGGGPKRGVQVETMTLSEEELGELLGAEAARALRQSSDKEEERAYAAGQKPVFCQRCHAMRSGKQIDERLRVGFSVGDDLLHPDRFKRLIASLRTKRCIFLLVLDLISPELLPALPELVRVNPLYVAVTKCDLLPGSLRRHDAPFNSRAEGFQKRCVTNTNVVRNYFFQMLSRAYDLRNFSVKNVFAISNKSGAGLTHLINAIGKEAIRRKRPVYVVGAANAGKSSFLNKILAKASAATTHPAASTLQKPQLKGIKAAAAASAVPGTTLDFIPMVVNRSWKIIDTPGIFLKGSYASFLTQEELQAAVPSSALHLCSASVAEGRGVWLGGLARVELLSDRNCFFSFFLSRSLMIRPCKATGVAEDKLETQRSHLFPPFSSERLQALSPLTPVDFCVEGKGWEEAAADIVLSGLGWISVTGCGPLRLRVYVPEEVRVYQRPALVARATKVCPAVSTRLLQERADRQVGLHRASLFPRQLPTRAVQHAEPLASDLQQFFPDGFKEEGSRLDDAVQ